MAKLKRAAVRAYATQAQALAAANELDKAGYTVDEIDECTVSIAWENVPAENSDDADAPTGKSVWLVVGRRG